MNTNYLLPYSRETLWTILSHIKPVHVQAICLFKIHFNIILIFRPRSYKWYISFQCPYIILCAFLFYPMQETCTVR